MSSKGSDASCVPLCVRHHDQLDGRSIIFVGAGTPKTKFEMWYAMDLAERSQEFFMEWKAFKGETNG